MFYSHPIVQDSPLLNALLETLLFFVCPFVIAILLGGSLGMRLFLKRHPLFAMRANPRLAASARPLPFARAMTYLGLLPILFLSVQFIPGMVPGTALLLLLSLGATGHLASHIYRELNTLDASILEMALASGLDHRAMIRRVLLPLGKNRILHAVCETALFLLAMETAVGFMAGIGLANFAMWSAFTQSPVLIFLFGLLLLLPLFLITSWLCAHFAKKQ